MDGQPRGGGKEYLAIIAKDGEKKGFFIRIVDKEVRVQLILICFHINTVLLYVHSCKSMISIVACSVVQEGAEHENKILGLFYRNNAL